MKSSIDAHIYLLKLCEIFDCGVSLTTYFIATVSTLCFYPRFPTLGETHTVFNAVITVLQYYSKI